MPPLNIGLHVKCLCPGFQGLDAGKRCRQWDGDHRIQSPWQQHPNVGPISNALFPEGVCKPELEGRAFVDSATVEVDHDRITSPQRRQILVKNDTICFLMGKALLDNARHKPAVTLGQKDFTPPLQSTTESLILHLLGQREHRAGKIDHFAVRHLCSLLDRAQAPCEIKRPVLTKMNNTSRGLCGDWNRTISLDHATFRNCPLINLVEAFSLPV
jgi:hypothetical protein